jgi:thiamine biosynthesis protein ThiI
MYTHILIRFGELSTKGKNKMAFVRKLAKNINKLLKVETNIQFDRIYISYSKKNIENLQYIFGIYSYSPTIIANTDDEEINDIALNLIKNKKDKTFKVKVKKSSKKYKKSSMEKEKELGNLILKQNKNFKVNLSQPDIKIEVEIRDKNSYIFLERILGIGGYPIGVNGKILHLISGGIDSPVAAFKMMKRGVHIDFLNFIVPPHTDRKTIVKVNKIINLLNKYQGKTILYRSNYTKLMNYIGLTYRKEYKIILMRRSFYRIASNLALKNKYQGISNGENLGQVASQTINSMHVIQNQSKYPVYRPILTNDKLETINEAKKIGTYEISIKKANETCELFAPKNPVIKPRIYELEKLEKDLDELSNLEFQNVENNIEKISFIK